MKNPRLVAFGKHIRVLRKELGVSQEELAALAGLDRSYLGHIERGETNITLLKLYQLAEALHKPASALIPQADWLVSSGSCPPFTNHKTSS